jgi:hypothetical protein
VKKGVLTAGHRAFGGVREAHAWLQGQSWAVRCNDDQPSDAYLAGSLHGAPSAHRVLEWSVASSVRELGGAVVAAGWAACGRCCRAARVRMSCGHTTQD